MSIYVIYSGTIYIFLKLTTHDYLTPFYVRKTAELAHGLIFARIFIFDVEILRTSSDVLSDLVISVADYSQKYCD